MQVALLNQLDLKNMKSINLNNADLRKADLSNASFDSSILMGYANLDGAKLNGLLL